MPNAPTITLTPDAAVGLQCPYCQTPLGAGESIATCADCGTGHHEECWSENQGCAVPGCVSGPDPLAQVSAPPELASVGAGAEGSGGPARLSIPVEESPRRLGRRSGSAGTATPIALQNAPARKRSKAPLIVGGVVGLAVIGVVALLATSPPEAPRGEANATCGATVGMCAGTGSATRHTLNTEGVKAVGQTVVRDYYSALAEGTEAGRERAFALLSIRESNRVKTQPGALDLWNRRAALIGADLENTDAAAVSQLLTPLRKSRRDGLAQLYVRQMRWVGRTCSDRFEGVVWIAHEGEPDAGTWSIETVETTVDRPKVLRDAKKQALGAACLPAD